MAKAVRMADIAERLGISVVSVSKGLSGKDGVSDEMRSRILEAAQQMGYQHYTAKKRELVEAGSIGVVVADRYFNENAFYYNLYRELLTTSQKKGISVLMEIVTQEAERDRVMPNLVLRRKVSGIILMGEFRLDYVETVMNCGLPYILLDFYREGIAADCVLSDNVQGGYALTESLLQSGRTRIGFVGSILATSSIMDRYLGYCKALLRHGINPNDAWRLEDRDDEGLFIPFALPQDMPDAFVCNCDEVAYNFVERLKAEGYRIPEDIAVTGYDDFRFSSMSNPRLTTYRVNVRAMAESAVAALNRKMLHKSTLAPTAVIPGTFVKREST